MKTFRDFGINLPDHFHGDRKTLCPRCSSERKHKTEPCLSVNGDLGVWKCHNCGWEGSIHEREDFLPRHHSESKPEPVYRKPAPETVRNDLNTGVIEYFRRRGISAETLRNTGVFSTTHYLAGTGRETLCFAFPYYKNGELLNIKYRDARKNMTQEKDPEPCLWNIDACLEANVIYITEGEIDALSLIECGIVSAVSVDKGAPQERDSSADKKLECVRNCIAVLNNAESVVICSDKDGPGLRLERELIALLGPAKCKIATYPNGCKDLNDVLVKYGPEVVRESVRYAESVPVPGIHRFSDFRDEILDLYYRGKPRGLSTGWPEFDQIYTLQPGSMNVITAAPESGKTEFAHALMVNTIRLHNWKWGIFSPEMMPVKNLFSNFAEKVIGNSFFGKKDERIQPEELTRALEMIDHSIFPIVPDCDVICNVENLLEMAKVLIVRHGINGFLLDPWNELETTIKPGISETTYTGQLLQKIVRFARQYNIWFGIVAHPAKLKKDDSGQYPVPTLYDISGSANFFNKADSGIALWRDRKKKTNIVQVHVQKVKNKYIGISNYKQDFSWDRRSGRFTPVPDEPEPQQHPEQYSGHRYSTDYLPYKD